jgi:DNA-directed RNA polymerase specialized sigma24 family protein
VFLHLVLSHYRSFVYLGFMDDIGPDREPPAAPARQFQTTRVSMIVADRDGGTREAREALAALCGIYWYPLYAFVRSKGYDAEASQDLVQGFIARLIEKNVLADVDRQKGRFRSFLMAACTHYLMNQAAHARARKRGGGKTPVSIDRLKAEARYGREPSHNMTPEKLFERQWAFTILDIVLGRLEAEMSRAGKERQLELLRPALLGQAGRVPYAKIGEAMSISEDAARAAAQRLRRRYRAILREEVARTLDDSADVDEEILDLFSTLVR